MADFSSSMQKYQDLPEEEQKRAGQAIAGDMDGEHTRFIETISLLMNEGKIDTDKPESFLNQDVYAGLEPEWKAKTDLAIVNIADLLRQIKKFYDSKETPNASPQLATMIESLWQMKQRIEVHANVFVF